ncbi:MAG: GTP-binding protein, partial [Brevundimonas sp.]
MAAPVRLITCGSVDDGKSTLIGRLLHDMGAVPADQMAALGPDPDLSLLVDGLAAEREQGITIDVAYRFFDLDGRRFILADTPGHEQYTRNMATAASTADVAVVLVDARKGVLTQTRRHTRILALMGVRRLLLAVNKMDLVGHDPALFTEIETDYRAFASTLGLEDITAVPLSALTGAGVTRRDPALDWFNGPTLTDWLAATPSPSAAAGPFRLPVQTVIRNGEVRAFAGRVAQGDVQPGAPVRILPSGAEAVVAMVNRAGASVSLTLDRPVDVSRGDWLVSPEAPPSVADQFEAHLVWMSDQPLLPGRIHDLKIGTTTVPARVMEIKH